MNTRINLEKVKIYRCRSALVLGHGAADVFRSSREIFKSIAKKTKRRPYVRSGYFQGEKVFLDYFWQHLNQKNPRDRKRRLRYFECGIELIRYSKCAPICLDNPKEHEKLYRFIGHVQNQYFIVQIKEDMKRNQRFLLSIFPYEK